MKNIKKTDDIMNFVVVDKLQKLGIEPKKNLENRSINKDMDPTPVKCDISSVPFFSVSIKGMNKEWFTSCILL